MQHLHNESWKPSNTEKPISRILISQPKPDSEKSPYYELAKKHNLELFFKPFIKIESIHAKEFRKQKINISEYSSVIFTSRHAIEHFFRMVNEIKLNIDEFTKYFCVSEAVARYLQKFIEFRKRKVFFAIDGTNKTLLEMMSRYIASESFLYVCSENQQDNEIVNWLKQRKSDFKLGFMYRSVSCHLSDVINLHKFDIVCLFTPSGVKALFDNFPKFKQKNTQIATFGNNTFNMASEAGLDVSIQAPQPHSPSIVTALDKYFNNLKKEVIKVEISKPKAKEKSSKKAVVKVATEAKKAIKKSSIKEKLVAVKKTTAKKASKATSAKKSNNPTPKIILKTKAKKK